MAIEGFAAAVTRARELLLESDAEWERLRPLMRVEGQAEFEALRDGYRSGIPTPLDKAAVEDAERLLAELASLGGPELTGEKGELSPGTFWETGAD
jgi:NitT/TauT family transport system substrate-binding protein